MRLGGVAEVAEVAGCVLGEVLMIAGAGQGACLNRPHVGS